MILRDTELLKEWLIPRLTPICHTDPQALADYIIGLIKKDKPVRMLKDICVEELQVFLMRETVPLVDRLFEVLEGELYLSKGNKSQELGLKEKNYTSALRCIEKQKTKLDARTKPDLGMDNQNQGRIKRMKESTSARRAQGEVMHAHASMRMKEKTKNIRKSHESNKTSLSNNKQDKYNFSDEDSAVEYTTSEENKRDTEDESPIFEDQPKPGRCKDYDEKGYCLLGDSCPYDHGSDPFVLEPAYNPPLQVALPPIPLIAPPILPINPSDPRLMLPPPVTQLPISTSNSVSTPSKTLSATDGYNPENPAYDSIDGDNTVPISGAHGIPPPPCLDSKPIQSQAIYNQMRSVNSGEGVHMTTISNGGNKMFTHNNQLSTALILRKVPLELNTVAKLSNHFEKFGTVVNVQVRYDNDPEGALVRFVTPQEAKKAHDCTDAVLGNRFIRVFYSRRDRNTSYPPKLKSFELASSIDLVKESLSGPSPLNSTESEPDKGEISPEDQDIAPTPTAALTESMLLSNISSDRKPSAVMSKVNKPVIDPKVIEKNLEIQKRKQELLDQYLKQQKVLFGKFTKSSSLPEKERIKSQIKEVNEQMNKLRTSTEQVQALKTATARMVNNSAQEKKRQETRPTFEAPRTVRPLTQPPKDLRGIIDRKPRSLLILSIKVTEKDELMAYLEMFGMIEQVNFNPDDSQLLVTYRTRQEAEKLVHSTYPFKGRNLIMKWSAPKKPLRSQLKYINTRARPKPGHNIKLTRPSLLEMSSERKSSAKGDMLTPDFNIGFDTDIIDGSTNIIESSEEIPLAEDAFGSISSPGEISFFKFLEPQISIIDESENDEEEEVYWRRRDKV